MGRGIELTGQSKPNPVIRVLQWAAPAAVILFLLAACNNNLLEIIHTKILEDTAKQFLEFRVNSSENRSVSADVTGIIDGQNITVSAPLGTDRSSLIAVYDAVCDSVKIGETPQVSGITINDFTVPVTYTLTAADNSSTEYIVTITINTEGVGIWDQSTWDNCLWGE